MQHKPINRTVTPSGIFNIRDSGLGRRQERPVRFVDRAGIDPIAVGDIRDLVSRLKHRGIGVLITEHNVRETLDIIDRAYILNDGRVIKEGTPSEIVSDEGVRRVYLGDRFNL